MAAPSEKRMKTGEKQLPTRAFKSWSQSKSSVITLEHVWEIENFSFQPKKTGTSCFLSSPMFSDQTENGKQWNLRLFPYGDVEKNQGFIGIFLDCLNIAKKNLPLLIKYKFTVMNRNQVIFAETKFIQNEFTEEDNSWGLPKILDYNKGWLTSLVNKTLPDDSLIVKCELMYEDKKSVLSGLSNLPSLPSTGTGTWINHFKNLLHTNYLSDIVVTVKGRKFDAHKLVLSTRSPVLAAMFQTNFSEKQTNTLNIEDIEPDAFAEMMRFLYTDEVENLDGLATDLLAAADKYMLDLLKTKCEVFLADNITVQNCSQLLLLSDLHSADGLKKIALDFVRSRSDAIVETTDWQELLESARPQLLRDISKAVMAPSKTFV